jgi:ribose transport system substrate-binding protein
MKGRPVNRKCVMPVAGALGAVVLTLSMASCTSSKPQSGGSGETSNGAKAPTSEAAATTVTPPAKASKNYNIQLLQGVIGDQFYITMQCGA